MRIYKKWTDEEWRHCLKCFQESSSIDEAVECHQYRYPQRDRASIQNKFYREGMTPASEIGMDPDLVYEEDELSHDENVDGKQGVKLLVEKDLSLEKLRHQNKQLRAELAATRREAISGQKLVDLVHDVKDVKISDNPGWLVKKKSNEGTTGIPVLFLSDIHFDEFVDPAQLEYVNEYNHDIAVNRIKYTFQTCIDLCKNHMKSPQYDGIVVALGGDLLSGNIHEELSETNEAPILQSTLDLVELLTQGLKALADEFGKVFVPCVVGNHGRLHHKPRAKNRVKDNYEWIIYHILAKHFSDDERVSFHIPESTDVTFNIYSQVFLLTHGDQFRGGSGISGIFSPLSLGMHRKQKRQQAVGKPFDIMMLGHWHQYIHTESMIVNGSIKGYDEYAAINNFPFEEPKQALFIVHPVYGITYRMPIECNGYDKQKKQRRLEKKLVVW